MTNLDKFKEVLKKLDLTHEQYFTIVYAAIELSTAQKIEGIKEMHKIYKK